MGTVERRPHVQTELKTDALVERRETWVDWVTGMQHIYAHATGPGWQQTLKPATPVPRAVGQARVWLAAFGDTYLTYWRGSGQGAESYIEGEQAWYMVDEPERPGDTPDGVPIVRWRLMKVEDKELV